MGLGDVGGSKVVNKYGMDAYIKGIAVCGGVHIQFSTTLGGCSGMCMSWVGM